MPAKIIPVVDGKNKTWADIQAIMGGVTRQQAQAKYKKVQSQGPVTLQSLQERFQAPEVKARKEENLNAVTKQNILNHARTHGPTHTSLVFSISRDEVVQMLDAQNREIKKFYSRAGK